MKSLTLVLLTSAFQSLLATDLLDFPHPPWTRNKVVYGRGFNNSQAQMSCRSVARREAQQLETTCRSYGGSASTSTPFCTFCQELGSQWQCRETVRVRCS